MSLGKLIIRKNMVVQGSAIRASGILIAIGGGLPLGMEVGRLIKEMMAIEPFVRWFIYGCIVFIFSVVGFVVTEVKN